MGYIILRGYVTVKRNGSSFHPKFLPSYTSKNRNINYIKYIKKAKADSLILLQSKYRTMGPDFLIELNPHF